MKRRDFVTALGIGTASAALVGCNAKSKDCDVSAENAKAPSETSEKKQQYSFR